ncbi:MAG: hypothetical protein KatS3mg088_460 [Patescibacteria group bacterium]|nr:MAG: hypothetical protein KatS3mg088_460 [Patescibacteria group bacterium]
MIGLLKKILTALRYILSKNNISNLVFVYYKKISVPKKIVSGYEVDMDIVAKRYLSGVKNYNSTVLLNDFIARENISFLEKSIRKIGFRVEEGMKFLDVGCGNGFYGKIIKKKGSIFEDVDYAGCEFHPKLVEVCKKLNPNFVFFLSRAEKIDSPDNFYDFVFSSGVLHYTLRNWKKSVLEFKRVSKSFIFITRIPLSKYEKTFYVQQKVWSISGIETHYFVVPNRDVFENFLVRNGLEILERDYSLEEYIINGVKEKIILSNYFLRKVN